MKNIFLSIILFGTLSLFFTGCSEDFLTKEPYASQTELVYFKTPTELEEALVGAYKAVSTSGFKVGVEFAWWSLGNIGSDDALMGSGTEAKDPQLQDISMSRQLSSNIRNTAYWSAFYTGIARANLVIDKSSVVSGDTATINTITRQAKFLRALCYYNLVIYWGNVPLFTNYADVATAIRPKSPAADIWDLILQDCKDATKLPTRSGWGQTQYGRVTSGAAWSLLGKSYMWQKKYSDAASAFKKVIDSKEYSLLNDFGKVFRDEGNNSSESIFETQHLAGNPASLGSLNVTMQLPVEVGGFAYNSPTQNFFDEFENGDPRIIYTFLFKGDVFPTKNGTLTITNKDSMTPFGSRKAFVSPLVIDVQNSIYDVAQNIKYLRYSEVLLQYAEALNETGKSAEALPYLEMVRARARQTPTTDPQRKSCTYDLSFTGDLLPAVTTTDQIALRNAIYHEYRIELGEEGHRREILLRTGKFFEQMNKVKNLNLTDAETYYFMPIPVDDIIKSNGVLTQNGKY